MFQMPGENTPQSEPMKSNFILGIKTYIYIYIESICWVLAQPLTSTFEIYQKVNLYQNPTGF